MPFVHIRITDDGVTDEQKSELIARVTQALSDVLGKKPEHTHVVIDEVPQTNWGYAGVRTDLYRAGGGGGAGGSGGSGGSGS